MSAQFAFQGFWAMIDHTTKGVLLCRAIRVLAYFDIGLVITSSAGQAYHFEMDGKSVQESDLVRRAAMLDPTFFDALQDSRFDDRRQTGSSGGSESASWIETRTGNATVSTPDRPDHPARHSAL